MGFARSWSKKEWVSQAPCEGHTLMPDDGQSEDISYKKVTGPELFSPFDLDFEPTHTPKDYGREKHTAKNPFHSNHHKKIKGRIKIYPLARNIFFLKEGIFYFYKWIFFYVFKDFYPLKWLTRGHDMSKATVLGPHLLLSIGHQ